MYKYLITLLTVPLFLGLGAKAQSPAMMQQMGNGGSGPHLERGTHLFYAPQGIQTSSIWSNDGTNVEELGNWPGKAIRFLQEIPGANGAMFIVADGQQAEALYQSDGTVAGTFSLSNLDLFMMGTEVISHGKIYLRLADTSTPTTSYYILVTDGTAAGTMIVPISSHPHELHRIPGHDGIFFFAATASGTKQYFLDGGLGTIQELSLLPDVHTTYFFQGVAGTKSIYNIDGEIWTSDGTAAGTEMIMAFGNNDFPWMDIIDQPDPNFEFFSDDVTVSTCSYFTSDGTAAGTQLVQAFSPVSGFSLREKVDNGSIFAFQNSAGQHLVYKTDGTSAGTQQMGTLDEYPLELCKMAGNNFYNFFTQDSTGLLDLWKLDPVSGNMSRVADMNLLYQFGQINHIVNGPQGEQRYYVSQLPPYNSTQSALWVSDGTAAGTQMLNAYSGVGALAMHSFPGSQTAYFFLRNTNQTDELWKTEGTQSSTELVATLSGNAQTAQRPEVVRHGTQHYFTTSHTDGHTEIWASDGTTSGTHMLLNNLGAAMQFHKFEQQAQSDLYFFGYPQGTAELQLWRVGDLVTDAPAPLEDIDLPRMYPNPGSHLNLQVPTSWSQGKAIQFRIVAVDGRMIAQGQLQAGLNELPVSQLENAMYLLEITAGSKRLTKKWIKQE